MRLRQRERKRSADLGANLLQTAIFRSNLTTSLVPSVGAGGPTWSRATKAWGFNELGYLEELASGCAFFGGARLVYNYLRWTEDLTNSSWVKTGSPTVTANTFKFNAQADRLRSTRMSVFNAVGKYAFVFIISADAPCTVTLDITDSTDGNPQFPLVVSVTTTPTEYKIVSDFSVGTMTSSAVAVYLNRINQNASVIGRTVTLSNMRFVDVTGYDASYIPEYVSVGVEASPYFGAGIDGAKYFGTDQNGLALGRDKLLGFRRESAATNNLLYCRDLRQVNWTTSPTGAEFVVNGGFGADTDWTKETGWSIAAGVATKVAGTGGSLKQVILTTAGTTYYVEIVCTVSAGTLSVAVGASGIQTPNISASGTYTYKIIAGTGTQTLNVYGSATYAGTVDSVSVKEAVVQVTQATGLDGIANTATTLTATAVDAIILQPTSGIASADRCASAYVKRRTGTGTISFTQDGTNWTDITALINSSTWSRVEITATLADPSVGFKISTSGDEIDVDVVQNEAGTVATSPIVTTTTAISRNAESLTYQTAGNIDFAVGTIYGYLISNTGGARAIASIGDSNCGISSTGTTSFRITDGTTTITKSGLSDISTAKRKRAGSWGGLGMLVTGDGQLPASIAFDGVFGSGTTINPGGSGLNGYIGPVAIWNYQMTDAQLQEVTK